MARTHFVACTPQDYRDELATPACRSQVHMLTQRAAQDVRFDEPLADACFEDRARLCDGVQPVGCGGAQLPGAKHSASGWLCCKSSIISRTNTITFL